MQWAALLKPVFIQKIVHIQIGFAGKTKLSVFIFYL